MDSSTDVSTAQTFDAGAFFNNLLSTAGNVYVATKTAPSQPTGQPAATNTPVLVANAPSGAAVPVSASGISSQTLLLLGLGAAVIVGVVMLSRK